MPPVSIEFALLAGRAVFLVFCFVLAAVTFIRWRRAGARSHAELAAQMTQVLERLTALDTRIDATQASLAALNERLTALQGSSTATPGSRSYEIAIRMARGGAAREELMASCGLTRQEAELVQRLHAPAPRPVAVAV